MVAIPNGARSQLQVRCLAQPLLLGMCVTCPSQLGAAGLFLHVLILQLWKRDAPRTTTPSVRYRPPHNSSVLPTSEFVAGNHDVLCAETYPLNHAFASLKRPFMDSLCCRASDDGSEARENRGAGGSW
jgi:hypothetical protein